MGEKCNKYHEEMEKQQEILMEKFEEMNKKLERILKVLDAK